MKILLRALIALFVIYGSTVAEAGTAVSPADEAGLRNLTAVQALALANEWKKTGKDARTYVNTRSVVFELKNGRTYKIPLPDDKLVVAVAPYINQTHE